MSKTIPRIIPRRRYVASTPDVKRVRSYVVPKHLLDPTLAWLKANCGPGNCRGQTPNWWLSNAGGYARSDGGGYVDFAIVAHADAFAVWMRQHGEQALTPDQKNGFATMPAKEE